MFSSGEGSASEPASMYERALGGRLSELAPQLQTYFGAIPEGFEGVGTGTYEHAGLRTPLLWPLFRLLGHFQIAFAERGQDVPFTIVNTPTTEGGRRARRVFDFPTATREMRDEMNEVNGRLYDRLGARGRLEVALDATVASGSLQLTSRGLAMRLPRLRIPLPRVVTVTVTEQALPGTGNQRVEVRMTAPLLGEIYGYAGAFTYALHPQHDTPAATNDSTPPADGSPSTVTTGTATAGRGRSAAIPHASEQSDPQDPRALSDRHRAGNGAVRIA